METIENEVVQMNCNVWIENITHHTRFWNPVEFCLDVKYTVTYNAHKRFYTNFYLEILVYLEFESIHDVSV